MIVEMLINVTLTPIILILTPILPSNLSRVRLVRHIMCARHVKTWESVGYTALANVKSYSQVAKPLSTKKTKVSLK